MVKLRQYQEAFLAYEKAAKIKPDSADALTGLGISLFFLKRYPDAISTLQAALKLNPNQGLAQEALKTAMQQQIKK